MTTAYVHRPIPRKPPAKRLFSGLAGLPPEPKSVPPVATAEPAPQQVHGEPNEGVSMDWFVQNSTKLFPDSQSSGHIRFQRHALDKSLGSLDGQSGAGFTSGGVEGDGRWKELRRSIDHREPFSYQIAKIRHIERKWETPDWMRDDRKVLEFLKLRFPNITTDPEQTRRAAKWQAVIWLYFRKGEPAGERDRQTGVDLEKNWKPGTAASIVLKIRRTLQGRNQANGKLKTGRKRGRPKKIQLVIPELKAA
jgi:hypothetical protein